MESQDCQPPLDSNKRKKKPEDPSPCVYLKKEQELVIIYSVETFFRQEVSMNFSQIGENGIKTNLQSKPKLSPTTCSSSWEATFPLKYQILSSQKPLTISEIMLLHSPNSPDGWERRQLRWELILLLAHLVLTSFTDKKDKFKELSPKILESPKRDNKNKLF